VSDVLYPSIPDPVSTPESLLETAIALKQAVELLNGARLGDGTAKAITATDLTYVFGTPVPGATPAPPTNPNINAALEALRINVQIAFGELEEVIETSTTELQNSQQQALSEFQSLLDDETNNRIDADATIQAQVEAIIVTNNEGAIAAIATETAARVAGDNALAGQITSLSAVVSGNGAAIANESIARANADSALSTNINSVSAIASRKRVFVQSTQPTAGGVGDLWIDTAQGNLLKSWDGDSWEASDDTRIGVNAAAISTESIARADADSAIANQITTINAIANGNAAAISEEALVRAQDDEALAVTIDSLDAQVGSNAAAISSEAATRASADTALAGTISTIQTQTNNNAAAIVTETAARTSGDSALAATQTSLTTTVNGHTASITSQQASLNGVLARYALTLNVNGKITGFSLLSGAGIPSEFAVQADKFFVSNGPTDIPVFVLESGTAFLAGARIKDGDITANKLAVNSVTAVKMAANSVTTLALAADVVTTPKILGGAVSSEVVFNFPDMLGIAPTGLFIDLFGMSSLVELYDVASLCMVTTEFTVTGFDENGARVAADARYRFKMQTRSSIAQPFVDVADTYWLGVQTGSVNSAIGQTVSLSYAHQDIDAVMAKVLYRYFFAGGVNTINIYNPRIIISGRLR
jgi:hypothetical protein